MTVGDIYFRFFKKPPPKVCIECRYCGKSEQADNPIDALVCSHPILFNNLVGQLRFRCKEVRTDEDYCGKEGKLFEPEEE